MSDELDRLLDQVIPNEEPPTSSPAPGETYQGLPVAQVRWQHPNHELWARLRNNKQLEPPFYVALPSGALAWVPWPGSTLVTQDDAAWTMDLLQTAPGAPQFKGADPKPSQQKKR